MIIRTKAKSGVDNLRISLDSTVDNLKNSVSVGCRGKSGVDWGQILQANAH